MATAAGIVDRVKHLLGLSHDAPSAAPKVDPKPQPGFMGAVKEVGSEFNKDDGMTQAAALAFYTGLSMAPLLSIAVWITQIVMRSLNVGDASAATEKIKAVAAQIIGPTAAQPIDQLLKPATEQAAKSMNITGILSILFLAISASGVFGQLQSSLNIMWNVKTEATNGSGIVSLIRKRLLSFGMLFTLLFLMLVSMLLSGILSGIQTYLEHAFGGDNGHKVILFLLQLANQAVTFVMAVGVFTLIFKYLPDVHVPWRDTIIGAAITALLFVIGKYGLGLYLGRGSYETSYGAAIGSFVALLVWVYYTSVIIFIGAESTQVYARRNGHEPTAEAHAVKTRRSEKVMPNPQPVAPVSYSATVPVDRRDGAHSSRTSAIG